MVVILFDALQGLSVLLEYFFGQPALDAGSAVGESYDANRYVEHGIQLAGEEKRRCAHPEYTLMVGILPATALSDIVQRLVGLVLGDGEHPHLILQPCIGYYFGRAFDRTVEVAANGHLHIGLAAGNPDFSNKNILYSKRTAVAFDFDLILVV